MNYAVIHYEKSGESPIDDVIGYENAVVVQVSVDADSDGAKQSKVISNEAEVHSAEGDGAFLVEHVAVEQVQTPLLGYPMEYDDRTHPSKLSGSPCEAAGLFDPFDVPESGDAEPDGGTVAGRDVEPDGA